MAISVRKLYQEVCDVLLEPSALTGDTVSNDDFLDILNDSLRDFLQSSECYKKIDHNLLVAGTRVYENDYFVNQPTHLYADEDNLYRSSGNYWDNSDYRWQLDPNGIPAEWRNDQVQENQVEIRPAPSWSGNSVTCSTGLYGTISSVSGVVDFDITVSAPLYGTISSTYTGPVYTDVTSPMAGTIAALLCSATNLTQIFTYTLEREITSLDDYIPDIQDTFKPYIKFMILSRIFGMDGEVKNTTLQKYYLNRSQEAVRILRAVAQEILLEVA
jgi:hypothetical protein